MPEERTCFQCTQSIVDLSTLMPWKLRQNSATVWFHLDCFIDFVDDAIWSDIQKYREMERRAELETN